MTLTEHQKQLLMKEIKAMRDVLDNAEKHIIQGENPIVLGKSATAHTARHLRRILRVLDSFR